MELLDVIGREPQQVWSDAVDKLKNQSQTPQLLAKTINSFLYNKYSSSQTYYYTKDLTDIFENQRTVAVVTTKDECQFAETEEFLRRLYALWEYPKKLSYFAEFYRFQIENPRVFVLPMAEIVTKHNHKMRAYYYIKYVKATGGSLEGLPHDLNILDSDRASSDPGDENNLDPNASALKGPVLPESLIHSLYMMNSYRHLDGKPSKHTTSPQLDNSSRVLSGVLKEMFKVNQSDLSVVLPPREQNEGLIKCLGDSLKPGNHKPNGHRGRLGTRILGVDNQPFIPLFADDLESRLEQLGRQYKQNKRPLKNFDGFSSSDTNEDKLHSADEPAAFDDGSCDDRLDSWSDISRISRIGTDNAKTLIRDQQAWVISQHDISKIAEGRDIADLKLNHQEVFYPKNENFDQKQVKDPAGLNEHPGFSKNFQNNLSVKDTLIMKKKRNPQHIQLRANAAQETKQSNELKNVKAATDLNLKRGSQAQLVDNLPRKTLDTHLFGHQPNQTPDLPINGQYSSENMPSKGGQYTKKNSKMKTFEQPATGAGGLTQMSDPVQPQPPLPAPKGSQVAHQPAAQLKGVQTGSESSLLQKKNIQNLNINININFNDRKKAGLTGEDPPLQNGGTASQDPESLTASGSNQVFSRKMSNKAILESKPGLWDKVGNPKLNIFNLAPKDKHIQLQADPDKPEMSLPANMGGAFPRLEEVTEELTQADKNKSPSPLQGRRRMSGHTNSLVDKFSKNRQSGGSLLQGTEQLSKYKTGELNFGLHRHKDSAPMIIPQYEGAEPVTKSKPNKKSSIVSSSLASMQQEIRKLKPKKSAQNHHNQQGRTSEKSPERAESRGIQHSNTVGAPHTSASSNQPSMNIDIFDKKRSTLIMPSGGNSHTGPILAHPSAVSQTTDYPASGAIKCKHPKAGILTSLLLNSTPGVRDSQKLKASPHKRKRSVKTSSSRQIANTSSAKSNPKSNRQKPTKSSSGSIIGQVVHLHGGTLHASLGRKYSEVSKKSHVGGLDVGYASRENSKIHRQTPGHILGQSSNNTSSINPNRKIFMSQEFKEGSFPLSHSAVSGLRRPNQEARHLSNLLAVDQLQGHTRMLDGLNPLTTQHKDLAPYPKSWKQQTNMVISGDTQFKEQLIGQMGTQQSKHSLKSSLILSSSTQPSGAATISKPQQMNLFGPKRSAGAILGGSSSSTNKELSKEGVMSGLVGNLMIPVGETTGNQTYRSTKKSGSTKKKAPGVSSAAQDLPSHPKMKRQDHPFVSSGVFSNPQINSISHGNVGSGVATSKNSMNAGKNIKLAEGAVAFSRKKRSVHDLAASSNFADIFQGQLGLGNSLKHSRVKSDVINQLLSQ